MSSIRKRVPRSVEPKRHHDHSLQLSRWFLMSIGAWPQTSGSSMVERLSTMILVPVCSVAMAIITIPCLLYVLFKTQNIRSKLNGAGPLIHRLMGLMNYWTLLSRSDDIRDCMRHMEADWRYIQKVEEQKVMLRYAKLGRFIAILCALFMQGGAMLFNMAKAIKATTMVIGNETYTMYPLTCPSFLKWKFFDTRFSPANEIILGVQFLSTFVTSTSTMCICSLAAAFAMHACGQLRVLNMRLNELTDDRQGEGSAEHKLALIVEHHLRVLSFVARMESITNKTCFVELMGCTLNMCLLGFYTIMNWAAFDAAKITSYLFVYLSMCFNIFIFCYIGEVITEQCKNVGEMAYMTNWYKLRHRTALGLVLIIGRSSNVIRITAGKLFQLSIATFGDVIKSSMMYLNILRTIVI